MVGTAHGDEFERGKPLVSCAARRDPALPRTGRAVSEVTCLFLAADDFEKLLAIRPAIARRWLSSVADRLAACQARLLALLGGSLAAQVASLLAEEAVDGLMELPQRTLAAMLGSRARR
jgi:CRP-like cAMP-binding protein